MEAATSTELSAGPGGDPAGRPALALADYRAGDGSLRISDATVADYDDPAPGSLFSHPVWLRTYGGGDLVIVEGLRPGVPRLVFGRADGGLHHRGRLMRLDAGLVAGLGEILPRLTGAAYVAFEDVEIAGPLPASPRRLVFRYQNNWRLPLGAAPAGKKSRETVDRTKRKARALQREVADVTVRFDAGPDRAILDRIAEFGRARIEAQGRRYGIDAAEVGRLAAVAAEVGHGTVVRAGATVLAADLVCIVGDRAYSMTHGHDPAHQRSSIGTFCLITSIEACAARGLADFNLLWGDLPYKAQLGAERIELRTVVVRGPASALLAPGYVATLLRYSRLDLKRRLKPAVTYFRSRTARGREKKTA